MANMQLQRWSWENNEWEAVEDYDTSTDSRAEENAYYSYGLRRGTGPHRLLRDGKTVLGYDNPDDHYANG